MFRVADMHCDTISRLYELSKNGQNETLRENSGHLDLRGMTAGRYAVQNFALYTHLKNTADPYAYCMDLLSLFYKEMEANRDVIRPVVTGSGILKNMEEGKMSALLTVEEGGVCRGDLDILRMFYEKGVRMMTLTWNFENELAYPNRMDLRSGLCVPETERGLKEKGVEFVREMERLGMIIDVSHLGDAGIRDVLANVKGPIVASHSNARALASHPRNLPDEYIRAIAERGGVIGINFCAAFLKDFGPDEEEISRIDCMVEHMKYIRNLGGIGCLGLGTDFDGIDGRLQIPGAGSMGLLYDAMRKAGFTENEADAVFYKNVLDLYSSVLG